jgi:hypothetical protein
MSFQVFSKEAYMRIHETCGFRVTLTIIGFSCLFNSGSAWAKDPPSDLCSLLAPAQLQRTLEQPFGAAAKSKFPAPYPGQPAGTKCEYSSEKGPPVDVTLIAYVDASAAQAKQNFDKLSMWFEPKSKPAIGDSAYIDGEEAIHVLKGRVRYYITIEPLGNMEKQLKDLAVLVASEI